jgi:hypothetical protein
MLSLAWMCIEMFSMSLIMMLVLMLVRILSVMLAATLIMRCEVVASLYYALVIRVLHTTWTFPLFHFDIPEAREDCWTGWVGIAVFPGAVVHFYYLDVWIFHALAFNIVDEVSEAHTEEQVKLGK